MRLRLVLNRWFLPIVVTAAIAIWVYAAYWPRRQAMHRLAKQLEQMNRTIHNTTTLVEVKTELQKQLERTHEIVADGRKKINRSGSADILGKIAVLAKTDGLVVTKFVPQQPVAYKTLDRLPLQISCTGPYANVMAWLATLERWDPPVWLEEVNIAPIRQGSKAVQADVRISVFVGSAEGSG